MFLKGNSMEEQETYHLVLAGRNRRGVERWGLKRQGGHRAYYQNPDYLALKAFAIDYCQRKGARLVFHTKAGRVEK